MRDLLDALRLLHRAAGMLSTRSISEMIRKRDDLKDSVSHETVGMMLRGTRLIGWPKFECVVQLLAERSVNPVFDPAESVRRFHNLWLAAKDSVVRDPPTTPRPTAASTTADLLHPLIQAPRSSTVASTANVISARAVRTRVPGRLVTNLGQRNRTFVDRAEMHAELDRLFRAEPRLPVVLSGPGGVGKSQLAIEYAYRSIDRYDLIWFISADDGFGAREMLVELGSRMHIQPGDHRERTVVSVLRALEQTELRWLLIFDNATPDIPINTPVSGGIGDVLITTRAPQWTLSPARLIAVDVLTRSESVQYLRGADAGISAADADGVAGMLGDLPLALAQLVATRRATGMSLARYSELFGRHVQELLRTARAPYYPASIGATIMMSVGQLEARGAVLLVLELFAHLGADPVTRTLLRAGRHAAVTDVLRRCLDDVQQLRASLDEIARLGLIRIEDDGRRAVMHPLVRLALRENLSAESLRRGRANTHALLTAADPEAPDTPSNRADHALLTPHVLPSGLVQALGPECRGTVLHQIRYLYEIGDYERSQVIAEAAIASWTAAPEVGVQHESTLLAMRHLANALRELGRFTEARRLTERVVAGFEENPAFGPDHPLTLRARAASGTDLHIAGEYRQALAVECESYERYRRTGRTHGPAGLGVANNRGNSHRLLGQYTEAEHWHRMVVGERTTLLGAGHTHTYFARLNLAWDLLCLGRYHDAFVELVEIRGLMAADPDVRPGHRLVLFVGRAFAVALRRLGRHDDALQAAEENYAQCGESLGGDSEATLASGITYANSLAAAGRLTDALDVATETRQSLSRSFGANNPITLAAAVNTAIIIRSREGWNEADEFARYSHAQLTRQLGADHPYAICAANNVATGLSLDGRWGHARRLSQTTLAHAVDRYPLRHPDRLVLTANAGLDGSADGDESAGDAMWEAAVHDLVNILSPRHPSVVRLRARERLEIEIEPPPL